jgi:hypothetical protein
MKKLFLLVSITMFMSFFISCDQDEYFNDRWNSKEVYSLATKTRSIDVENNPVKMTYILSGGGNRRYALIPGGEINFVVSWTGGFTFDNPKLTIEYSFQLYPMYEIKDFYICNSVLQNDKAAFEFRGKLIDKEHQDTIPLMDEIIIEPVLSEEREVVNPNK